MQVTTCNMFLVFVFLVVYWFRYSILQLLNRYIELAYRFHPYNEPMCILYHQTLYSGKRTGYFKHGIIKPIYQMDFILWENMRIIYGFKKP